MCCCCCCCPLYRDEILSISTPHCASDWTFLFVNIKFCAWIWLAFLLKFWGEGACCYVFYLTLLRWVFLVRALSQRNFMMCKWQIKSDRPSTRAQSALARYWNKIIKYYKFLHDDDDMIRYARKRLPCFAWDLFGANQERKQVVNDNNFVNAFATICSLSCPRSLSHSLTL